MSRWATDALALVCIVAGGAAGTVITMAAWDGGGDTDATAGVRMSPAVVAVSGGDCPDDSGVGVVVAPRGKERAGARLEEARVRLEESRHRLEASRERVEEARRIRVEVLRERGAGR